MSQQIKRGSGQYDQLLNGLQKTDPRLYDLLKIISTDLKAVIDVVDPIQATLSKIEASAVTPPTDPFTIFATVTKLGVTFLFAAADTTATYFELREGVDWATGTFIVRTPSLTATINPLTAGTHTFWLKTRSASLVESVNAISIQVSVSAPAAPSVTTQVVDNNVLISWTEPTSDHAVDFYNIYKDNVKFAEISGTFTAKFEVVAGTYVYGVEAVDIAGNVGAQGSAPATVRQPPDYNLLDQRTSDFSGTKTNCDLINGKLIACIDTTEQFGTHFSSKGWTSPQDQVTAGYDRYIQENLLTGSYDESFDYGITISNTIVNYNYLKEIFTGTNDVTILIKTYYKVNVGDAWSGPVSGNSAFIGSFRYLRTVLEFTATDADSMIAVSNLVIRLDVKREVDGGFVNALASDATGTVVTFNKSFKDIDAITCTTDSVSPVTVIVDFVDAPDPTQFKVLCFDSGGRRVDQLVRWIARGII